MFTKRENVNQRRDPRTLRVLKQEEEPVNEAGKEERGEDRYLGK